MKEDSIKKSINEHAMIARVITQSTFIESIMDAYIAEYYTRRPNGSHQESYLSFLYDIMNERSVSLDAKKNILLKIFGRLDGKKPGESINKTFDQWLRIRNQFAHGRYIPEEGILYCGEFLDVQEKANKHAELQIKIHAILQEHKELIGPYFNHIPMKESLK